MSTICLNMIVKDEAGVIARCLRAARPLIDCYVIVDTGSTDETKDIIRRELAGVPGEIHDRPWVDFGHNRTEAIQFAAGKADYLLVVDADDEIVGTKPTNLTADTYHLTVEDGGLSYVRAQLFRARNSYRYVGVLHEILECEDKAAVNVFLPDLKYVRHGSGARGGSAKDKFTKDALVLEAALKKDPSNARYAFYLAQSWRDAGEQERALEAYEHRAVMQGWDEERWFSLFQVALLKQALGRAPAEVIDAFLLAFEARPKRIESMFELGKYLQMLGRHRLCYFLLQPIVGAKPPNDRLYVHLNVYTWGLKAVFAGSAFALGNFKLAEQISSELLDEGHLPSSQVDSVKHNLEACRKAADRLVEIQR